MQTTIASERARLFARCKSHDWWYMMSDDHRVYKQGFNNATALEADLKTAGCPYDMLTLRKAIHGELDPTETKKIFSWFGCSEA